MNRNFLISLFLKSAAIILYCSSYIISFMKDYNIKIFIIYILNQLIKYIKDADKYLWQEVVMEDKLIGLSDRIVIHEGCWLCPMIFSQFLQILPYE